MDYEQEKLPFIDGRTNTNTGSMEETALEMDPTRGENLRKASASVLDLNLKFHSHSANGDNRGSSGVINVPVSKSEPAASIFTSVLSSCSADENERRSPVNSHNEQVIANELERRNSFKHPIHSAAEKGQVQELERLLQKGDPLQTDFKKRTPLHYACGFVEYKAYQKKALKMVEVILKCPQAQNTPTDTNKKKRLLDFQDNNGETGLHIAATIGHREVVEKLLFSAADVNLRNKKNEEPLQLIYHRVPTAMIPVFDEAVQCKVGDPFDENLILTFDFGSIVGYLEPEKDISFFEMETKLLSYCLEQSEQKRSAILLHPVVQMFLHLKWKKIRILLWLSIFYHVIWQLLFTAFIVDLYLNQCPYKLPDEEENISHHDPSNSVNESPNESLEYANFNNASHAGLITCEVGDHLSMLTIELSFLYVVSISVALKEIYEIYSSLHLKYYFLQLENLGQWLLVGVVVLTAFPLFMIKEENIIEIYSWQYQVSAFGIFLAWSLILSQIGKIPRFGIYIEILVKVLKSFVMFMFTFASLLIAFMVSFQILMPDKIEFGSFPWGFIKVVVMMVGEINYDEVFYGEDTKSLVPFQTSTKLLFAFFVAIVTIILFNLLIGLTVSDIQGLQQVAQLSSLSSQLDQIYLMERFVISKKFQRWLKILKKNHWLRYFLVTQQDDNIETNMGVDLHIRNIPKNLQHQVRDKATPNTVQQNNDEEDPEDQDDQSTSTTSSENQENTFDETSASKNIARNEELKAQIKLILQEILDEMTIQNRI